MMVCTLCLPRENTTSGFIITLLWVSSPNLDWPISADGKMDRLPRAHCTQLVMGLENQWGRKRPLRYHRYFQVHALTRSTLTYSLSCVSSFFLPFSLTGFLQLLVSFCSIRAPNYYLLNRSQSIPFLPHPRMRLSKRGIDVLLYCNSVITSENRQLSWEHSHLSSVT